VAHLCLSDERVANQDGGIADVQDRHVVVDEKRVLDDRDERLFAP